MKIIVHTEYEGVSEDDLMKYIARLRTSAVLIARGVPQDLLERGEAEFKTPQAIGSGPAVTRYKLIREEKRENK